MSVNLPNGLEYRIDNVNPGIVYPGSNNEPILTISGRGATLQYRLISFAIDKYSLIDETYCEGDLSIEEQESIANWIYQKLPSLFAEVKIRHIIYFKPTSKCYYDFIHQQLYGGDGVKEKKKHCTETKANSILLDGNSCNVSDGENFIICTLTENPKTPVSADRLYGEEFSITTLKSLNQTWSRLRKYDTSIHETFVRKGKFIYNGAPPIWRIESEEKETKLTLDTIFRVVSTRNIVAILNGKFQTAFVSNISSLEIMRFLGFSSVLIDLDSMNIERFSTENYCDCANSLKPFFEKFYYNPDSVWEHLQKSIIENYTYSIRVSSFFDDTERAPVRIADLTGYPVSSERVENSLNRICPSIDRIIISSSVAANYFNSCLIKATPTNAVDYIVALILICFSDCQTPSSDESLITWKTRYQEKLLTVIQQKFQFSTPRDENETIIDELIRSLFELEEQVRGNLLDNDSIATRISEIRNRYNLGYNDDNSLFHSAMSKEL